MDPDIKRTVERIDQKIAKWLEIKNMLLDEFGGGDASGLQSSLPFEVQKATSSRLGKRGRPPKRRTRKDELVAFLLNNGPATRKEIRDKTGLPTGTLAHQLNDKQIFIRHQNRGWDLTAEARASALSKS